MKSDQKISTLIENINIILKHKQASLKSNQLSGNGKIHLRNLNLNNEEVSDIMHLISSYKGRPPVVTSLSFSYNPLISDQGACLIAEKLPQCITELGLVGCNIGDIGAQALLDKLIYIPTLPMICIEQNRLSTTMIDKWRAYGQQHHQILVIY